MNLVEKGKRKQVTEFAECEKMYIRNSFSKKKINTKKVMTEKRKWSEIEINYIMTNRKHFIYDSSTLKNCIQEEITD